MFDAAKTLYAVPASMSSFSEFSDSTACAGRRMASQTMVARAPPISGPAQNTLHIPYTTQHTRRVHFDPNDLYNSVIITFTHRMQRTTSARNVNHGENS